MARSTSTEDMGKGRRHAEETCRSYLGARREGDAPGTVVAEHLSFLARTGEENVEQVLRNQARRVGSPHDAAELLSGDIDASNCDRVVIELLIGSPEALAATHVLRSKMPLRPNDYVRLTTFELIPAPEAHEQLGDARLRLFDQRDNAKVPGLRQLHREGNDTQSAVWEELDATRERERVLAMLISSPPSEPAVTLIAWEHWLAALHAADLLVARRRKWKFKAKDLPLPPTYFKPISPLERLRRFTARLNDWISGIEDTAAAVKRLVKIFKILLMLLGATTTALVGASHADLLKHQAQHVIEKIVGR